MKRLFSPPIQLLLWLCSIAVLGYSAWNLWQLKLLVEKPLASSDFAIQLPNVEEELKVPAVSTYQHLVNAPLFWDLRAIPKVEPPAPVVVEAAPVEPEIVLDPPKGRLVGVVNLSDKRYAVIRGETKNLSLYQGDQWEGWTVDTVERDRVKISAGKQQAEVKLIADFAAPTESEAAVQRKKQQAAVAARMQNQNLPINAAQAAQAAQMIPADVAQNALIPLLQPAQVANENGQKPEQPMTIQEALEARQRLMAARWGNNNTDQAAASVQQQGQGQAPR